LSIEPAEVGRAFFAGVGVPFLFCATELERGRRSAAINRAAWAATLRERGVPTSSSSQEIYGWRQALCSHVGTRVGVERKILRQAALVPRSSGQWHRSRFWRMAYRLSIQQGVSMGRRSESEAEARKSGSVVTSVSVAAQQAT